MGDESLEMRYGAGHVWDLEIACPGGLHGRDELGRLGTVSG
jgi:hypothetical protein